MINKTFVPQPQNTSSRHLTVYFTAGYPELESTKTILETLNSTEVGLIEIGMPYSDPLADGAVIQETAAQALKNGMNVGLLFEQLAAVTVEKPVLLMGYFNQFLQFGAERFLQKCQAVGVSGLILPDLPVEVYRSQYQTLFEQYKQKICFLITAESAWERVQELAEGTTGFLYLVTSNATTGGASNLDGRLHAIIERVRKEYPSVMIQLGFGIRDAQSFQKASELADGAIIGSAFLQAMEREYLEKSVRDFVGKILD